MKPVSLSRRARVPLPPAAPECVPTLRGRRPLPDARGETFKEHHDF